MTASERTLSTNPPNQAAGRDSHHTPLDPTTPHISGLCSVGVSWRMVARGGKQLPLMTGLSYYQLDAGGRINNFKEASEQLVKMPPSLMPLLGSAAPLLGMLAGEGPAGLPAPPGGRGGEPTGGSGDSSSSSSTMQAAGASPMASQQASFQGSPSSSGGSGSSNSAPSSGTPSGSSGGASSSRGSSSSAGPPRGLGQLEGVWLKDLAGSDMASYDRMLQLLQLGGLQRTTALQVCVRVFYVRGVALCSGRVAWLRLKA